MKLLITGGCGFLGSNLAADALGRGDEVCVFDNLSRVGAAQNLEWLRTQGEVRFVHGDVRCRGDVERTVREFEPDVVFHLAGQVAMTSSIADPRRDFGVNALGTLNLLEAVRQWAPGALVVYSSTNKVYGDLEWVRYEERETRFVAPDYPEGFGEDTPLDFHSPYGCSKGAADQYMLDYHRIFGLRTVVFRHSSIYGGRQFATYDQGWVGWFCQKALEQKADPGSPPFTISGTGKQVRDILHADDLKRLYRAVVDRPDQAAGEVFNIGGGMANSLSLLELFAMLEELVGVELRYERRSSRQSDQKVFVARIKKAKRGFGWAPHMAAREGVRAMLSWLLSIRGIEP